MPSATFDTLNGDKVTLQFRVPRQSEILDMMSQLAGVTGAGDDRVADASEAHRINLSFVASLCDGHDAAWLDEHVPFDVLAEVARHLLASRLPGDDVLGKSRVLLA
jgi:hypothetical protein